MMQNDHVVTKSLMRRFKLIYIVTSPLTAKAFLSGQLSFMRNSGFDVVLVCSPGAEVDVLAGQEQIRIMTIPMQREIDLVKDPIALLKMCRLLLSERPDIIIASTPKAGMLGIVSAWIAHIPARIYHLRGLRLETTSKFKRTVLWFAEWLTASCSHMIVCDSDSLKSTFASMQLASANKLLVLGEGSCNGIDITRFEATSILSSKADYLKDFLQIPCGVRIIGYVGRLTRDKGIVDLIHMFEHLQQQQPDLFLLLVGDFEEGDPVPPDIIERIYTNSSIRLTGFVEDVVPYYHIMQILVFPSYREGFPYAPLEAAAAGIPTIGYNSTGVVDAVINGQTGFLVTKGDILQLGRKISNVLQDDKLRSTLGKNAKSRAVEHFSSEVVWQRWQDIYRSLLYS